MMALLKMLLLVLVSGTLLAVQSAPIVKKDEDISSNDPRCLTEDYFLCANGVRCVKKKYVCDGASDCWDDSDETVCIDCGSMHKCNNTNECINNSSLCDHVFDCSDSSDEKNCVTACASSDEFLCADGSGCIKRESMCNGIADCLDHSDERQQDCVVSCGSKLVLCADGPGSIPEDFGCGNQTGCQGDCAGRPESCATTCDSRGLLKGSGYISDFKCRPCVGVKTCGQGYDIQGEPICTCTVHKLLCMDNEECVLYQNLMDGKKDCLDGSDEGFDPEYV